MHPQTRRQVINAEKLHQAAIEQFAQHGLHGAKVSNIVAAAGLSQPSFYRLWPSKEAAYESIVESTNTQWREAAFRALNFQHEAPLSTELERGLRHLFEVLSADLNLTRLVLRHNSQSQQYPVYLALYQAAFEALQRAEKVRRDVTAEVLAQAYVALTERFLYARLLPSTLTPRQAARELTSLLLPMLAPTALTRPAL